VGRGKEVLEPKTQNLGEVHLLNCRFTISVRESLFENLCTGLQTKTTPTTTRNVPVGMLVQKRVGTLLLALADPFVGIMSELRDD